MVDATISRVRVAIWHAWAAQTAAAGGAGLRLAWASPRTHQFTPRSRRSHGINHRALAALRGDQPLEDLVVLHHRPSRRSWDERPASSRASCTRAPYASSLRRERKATTVSSSSGRIALVSQAGASGEGASAELRRKDAAVPDDERAGCEIAVALVAPGGEIRADPDERPAGRMSMRRSTFEQD